MLCTVTYFLPKLTHLICIYISVPFVPEIVSRVDLDGRLISMIPPDGLLDLSYRREEKVRIKGLLPPARGD